LLLSSPLPAVTNKFPKSVEWFMRVSDKRCCTNFKAK
jgi:hypothetical protein